MGNASQGWRICWILGSISGESPASSTGTCSTWNATRRPEEAALELSLRFY